LTTFWGFLFQVNEINELTIVKSSNVVFFTKSVVIFGCFMTTRVVKTDSTFFRLLEIGGGL